MVPTPAYLMVSALNDNDEAQCLHGGGKWYSYREVRDTVSQVVTELAARSIQGPVALLANNNVDLVFVVAAVVASGTNHVPLNARGSAADHAGAIRDAGSSVLLYDATEFEAAAREIEAAVPGLVLVPMRAGGGRGLLDCAQVHSPRPLVLPALGDDASRGLVRIGFTGGTTGKPKGVPWTAENWSWMTLIQLLEWDWPAEVRTLIVSPLSHSGIVMALPTWLQGGAIVLGDTKFDSASFTRSVAEHQVTCTLMVPTMIYALLDDERLDLDSLRSLETIFYGAAPISTTRLTEALRLFGPRFFQFYGQVEAPLTVSVLRKREHDPDHPERLKSCGKPVRWVQVSLLNGEGAEVTQVGEVGEIAVRGPLVISGYWNRPEETQAAITSDGWLRTGDLGQFDEKGFLYIVGRVKEMVISGGFNVYPREIEDVINENPAVASSAVFGLPDPKWGETVAAAVVLKDPGQSLDPSIIAEAVRAAKGPVATPKRIDFVDEMPLTSVGKIDKQQLRERMTLEPIDD